MKKYCKEELATIENIPGIYLIKNIINGKCYIGQSIYLRKRLLKHLTLSDRKMYDAPLYRAMQKYGIDVFEFDILKTLNTNDFKKAKTQLDIWEKEYIIKYNSFGDFGYNQTAGGDAGIIGYQFTEKQKQHQSEIRQEQEANKVDMLYLYIIDGPQCCKYITSCNLVHLNQILKYHNWKEINSLYLRNAKKYISIYNKYIVASSKEELESKIIKFNNSKIKKVDESLLEEYKKIVDSLSIKTVKEIMKVTGLDKDTIYNRNTQVYGKRILLRMRNLNK